MISTKIVSFLLSLLLVLTESGCSSPGSETANTTPPAESEAVSVTEADFTVDTPIADVMTDPAFGSFGRLLFPVQSSYYRGDTLGELSLTLYSHIGPGETVEIVNTLKNSALSEQTVFYDIYASAEKAADPAKGDTGLFFFKGAAGNPFAVCSAGGGFAYVGTMHDSFSHALELSKKGYNAFALIERYRRRESSVEEALIEMYFASVSVRRVEDVPEALWGGSAGGRMTAYLSSYGPAAFGGVDLPRPGADIIQYTGHSDYSGNEPPTYVCVGDSDGIASWRTMERRQNALSALGIETQFHVYPGLGHGFGPGTGTVAEGWLNEAAVRLGVEALAGFIREMGLPATLAETGISPDTDGKAIADFCSLTADCCKKLSREELLEIFLECR